MYRRSVLKLAAASMLTGKLSLSQAATNKTTGLVLDDQFIRHQLGAAHLESPDRYQKVASILRNAAFFDDLVALKARDDAEKWLSTIHSKAHQEAIADNYPQAYKSALKATGGALSCVDAVMSGEVLNAFCASRPPGHHATNTGAEQGFCFFNHAAIAARYAQQQYDLEKILIIDWDYHHGNGTEWAFYEDPSVLFFSTHDQFAYPGTGDPARRGTGKGTGFNINVHLPCGSQASEVLAAFEHSLQPALKTFKPELIVLSAGFDSHQDDPLGCHKISEQGFMMLTRYVTTLAAQVCQHRVVSIMEGGYSLSGLEKSVYAHVKELSHVSR